MVKKPVPKLPYDVPWILQRFRALLLGREHRSALRWAKDLAPKTQPLPDLPRGPSTKIRFNYYCDRDPRGEVKRPVVLYDAESLQKVIGVSGTGPAGCGPLEEEGKEGVTSEQAVGQEEEGMGKKVKGKDELEMGKKEAEREGKDKKSEEKVEKDARKKLEEKIEKEIDKKSGGQEEKDASKKAGENEEKVISDKVGKDSSKKAGEEEERESKKKEEEKGGKEVKKKSGGKGEEASKKAGEKEEKETGKKVGEKDEQDTNKKEGENKEKETSNAVKRVPGKVWHWDTIDGEPDKECCRVPRDGY